MTEQPQLIEQRVREKPEYDNTHIQDRARWMADNHEQLIRWWWQCDVDARARGFERPRDSGAEFEAFRVCQHDVAKGVKS